ncbi:DUF4884 domain-containing protein [Spirosoma agri]|uniref:DUF4884 domain-containing protein n=1 Tax=Spirosoma agri TaxID=1987381 RepID=A0A6M0ILP8_9BACT|nr:DUF4884 domain-containing protein [Spirosoma agri]NEU68331.1 DUF4884 domain-containing protein [Spirosoma agri]
MKRIFTLLALVLIAASCKSKMTPIDVVTTNNPGQLTMLLLEVDGCKVYRFNDGGRDVYFTTCKGKVSYDYTTRSGKSSTTHHVDSLTEELPR